MNPDIIIRYAIELAMIVPAAAYAIMPVYHARRVKKPLLFGLLAVSLGLFIAGGAVVCSIFMLPSNAVLFPCMVLFYIAYYLCFDYSHAKKIFCFANSVMICGFASTYSTFLTAPMELDNDQTVLYRSTALIRLGVSVLIGAMYTRALLVKFPELFENETLDSTWKVLMAAPITAAAAMIWINPQSASNVMTGRLRPICLVVLLSLPFTSLFLYHILWWLARKMTDTADLRQRYDLLKMEEKQFIKTQQYLRETSELRHDFRQHLLIIEDMLNRNEIENLKKYIAPIVRTANNPNRTLCANRIVDAIARHYDEIAKESGVAITWSLDLPEKLGFRESDMCAVLGNLLENAINAASKLEGDDRLVNIKVGMLSNETLVISIFNPYRGGIMLDKNGLPVTTKADHGIGLRSVASIVDRYNGSMEIETHEHIFNVSILMYRPTEEE